MSKPPRKGHKPSVTKSIKQPYPEDYMDPDEWSTSTVASVSNMYYEIRLVAEEIRTKVSELQNQQDPAVESLNSLARAAKNFAVEAQFAFGYLMRDFGIDDAFESPLEQNDKSRGEKSILADLTERAAVINTKDEPDIEHD